MNNLEQAIKQIESLKPELEKLKALTDRTEAVGQPKESKTNWHFWISLIKSGFRFGAGFTLVFGKLPLAGALFIIAEILGIAEEL